MLTPAFDIRQDDGFVYLSIKAPFTNVKNSDIYVHEDEFKFFSEPYFLRLNLPGHVLDSGKSTAKYDGDDGTFTIQLQKESFGEDFKDLELLTKLLAPKLKPDQALVEVVDQISEIDLDDEDGDIWQMKQELFEEPPSNSRTRKYGFNRSKSGVIGRLQEDLPAICDIRNPDTKSVKAARAERLRMENEKFDTMYYVADAFDEDNACQSVIDSTIVYEEKTVVFTDEEKEFLSKLPAKRYVMSKPEKLRCLTGLVDLMFAYAYTNRVNGEQWNSESGWTCAKLSATLSHFEEFQSLKAVCLSCIRRSVIYPLYRNMKLSSLCWTDTINMFEQGKKTVLRALLTIHKALQGDKDGRHVLNDLYINDYCIWLQRQCRDFRLVEIADRMKNVTIELAELELGLPQLERIIQHVRDTKEENGTDSNSESSMSAQDSDDYNSDDENADSSNSSASTSHSSSRTSINTLHRTL